MQIDAYIQLLRRQSGEAEVIQRLVQAFQNVDPSLQNRIATTLIDFDVPESALAELKTSIAAWKPSDDVAQGTKYQLLIRYGSVAVKTEIEDKMKAAVQNRDLEHVELLIRYIWQAFGGVAQGPSSGLISREILERGSALEPEVRRLLRARTRVHDAEVVASSYVPIFKAALDSPAGPTVVKMVLDIMVYSSAKLPEIEQSISKAMAEYQSSRDNLRSLIGALPRFTDNSTLYRKTVEILDSNSDKIVESQYPYLTGELLAYSIRNSSTLKTSPSLLKTTVGLLQLLSGASNGIDKDGIDREMLSSYLCTGNIFAHGVKIPLTNNKNRQQIADIQVNDKNFTPVDIEDQKFDLGDGAIVKIEKLLVDGSDPNDQRLGVQVILDVAGDPHTLTFAGSEQFLLQSKSPDHVLERDGHRLRFGIEIQSQRLTLMLGRL